MLQANRKPITLPLPRALPPAARAKVHTAIESHLAAVEALTAFLDEADGDENLEPSLGATEPRNWSDDRKRYSYCGQDLEEQCEDEGHDSDREQEVEEASAVAAVSSESSPNGEVL